MGRQRTETTTRAKTDDYARNLYQESDYQVVDRITQVAARHGVSNAQVALAWVLHKPGITSPIVGASKMPHLEEAVKALDLKLDESDLKALEESYTPHPVLGHA